MTRIVIKDRYETPPPVPEAFREVARKAVTSMSSEERKKLLTADRVVYDTVSGEYEFDFGRN